MERYRFEPHVAQPYDGIGSGCSTKYQLQQFRPITGHGIEHQCGQNENKQYDRIKSCTNPASRALTEADIYRELYHTAKDENRKFDNGHNRPTTTVHSCPEPEHKESKQQHSGQQLNEQYNTENNKGHSFSGRRYNFGRGGGLRRRESTECNKIGDTATQRSSDRKYGTDSDSTPASTHCKSWPDTGLRECECVAPEEKPILRPKYQHHSR